MAFRCLHVFVFTLEFFSQLDQFAFLSLDLSLSFLVGFFLTLQTAQVLLVLVLFTLEPALGVTILHTCLVNQFIATARVFNGVLPLQVQLVTLLMQTFEFLRGLVQLNLSGLSFGHFLLQLLCFAGDLNCKFFNLEGEFLDFGLISSSELLEGKVVFLLLAGGKCPLLQLLLVPVHL